MILLALLFGAAPPPDLSADVARLASADHAVRRGAFDRLAALDADAVPLLRRLAAPSLEVDVRLALFAAAGTIRARHWGPVKAFGPGAAVTTPGSGYWFNRVRFSRDGKSAVVAGGALIRFDLATGKEEGRVLEVGGARLGLFVTPDGKHALTSHSNDNTFHLAEVATLKTAVTFAGHEGGVLYVALSPDGTRVASASYDRTARIWDTKTGKELCRCADFRKVPSGIAFSADGRDVVVGEANPGGSHLFWVHDAATGKHLRVFAHSTGGLPTSFLAHPDRKTLVVSTADGFVVRLRLDDGKELMRLRHVGHIYDVALAPDGRRVLSAGVDRKVKVWDLDAGKLMETFDGHMGGVLGVAFSPDGTHALSCDAVAAVRLWKVGRP